LDGRAFNSLQAAGAPLTSVPMWFRRSLQRTSTQLNVLHVPALLNRFSLCLAYPGESGVDPWRQLLLFCNAPEQERELLALRFLESSADRVVVRLGHATDRRHRLGALVREIKGVYAAIVGIVAPLEEMTSFELVDERDEAARYHAEQGRERLLTGAGMHGNQPQNAGVGGGQVELLEPFGEAGRSVRTHLSKQKCGRSWMPERTASVSILHATKDTS
jgi:hypothetical protein